MSLRARALAATPHAAPATGAGPNRLHLVLRAGLATGVATDTEFTAERVRGIRDRALATLNNLRNAQRNGRDRRELITAHASAMQELAQAVEALGRVEDMTTAQAREIASMREQLTAQQREAERYTEELRQLGRELRWAESQVQQSASAVTAAVAELQAEQRARQVDNQQYIDELNALTVQINAAQAESVEVRAGMAEMAARLDRAERQAARSLDDCEARLEAATRALQHAARAASTARDPTPTPPSPPEPECFLVARKVPDLRGYSKERERGPRAPTLSDYHYERLALEAAFLSGDSEAARNLLKHGVNPMATEGPIRVLLHSRNPLDPALYSQVGRNLYSSNVSVGAHKTFASLPVASDAVLQGRKQIMDMLANACDVDDVRIYMPGAAGSYYDGDSNYMITHELPTIAAAPPHMTVSPALLQHALDIGFITPTVIVRQFGRAPLESWVEVRDRRENRQHTMFPVLLHSFLHYNPQGFQDTAEERATMLSLVQMLRARDGHADRVWYRAIVRERANPGFAAHGVFDAQNVIERADWLLENAVFADDPDPNPPPPPPQLPRDDDPYL